MAKATTILKGKSLKRAMATKDAVRLINKDIPLISDTTELITPEIAKKMLDKNKGNRAVNWGKVREFQKCMERGEWKFHAQGIILDGKGNILTGQKRLWAIRYSGCPQYMRVSKGSPADTANLIDRGASQTARDLGSRRTGRKHSPQEQMICRGILGLRNNLKPNHDELAECLFDKDTILAAAIERTCRTKKTKAGYMILAVICSQYDQETDETTLGFGMFGELANKLEGELSPVLPEACWNKGAAFVLALDKAVKVCEKEGLKGGNK